MCKTLCSFVDHQKVLWEFHKTIHGSEISLKVPYNAYETSHGLATDIRKYFVIYNVMIGFVSTILKH